jgi:hypothetical protein
LAILMFGSLATVVAISGSDRAIPPGYTGPNLLDLPVLALVSIAAAFLTRRRWPFYMLGTATALNYGIDLSDHANSRYLAHRSLTECCVMVLCLMLLYLIFPRMVAATSWKMIRTFLRRRPPRGFPVLSAVPPPNQQTLAPAPPGDALYMRI